MIIGITGGVGSGKSAVMEILKNKYHAKILIADDLGHEVMREGHNAYRKILECFGMEILSEDGTINRPQLAELIFHDDEKRIALNEIVHPYVLNHIRDKLAEWKEEPLVAVESAIMFESGCDALCDEVWAVFAKREICVKRLMSRRGYSMDKIERILARQKTIQELRTCCRRIIQNNGDFAELEKNIADIFTKDLIILRNS
jgi:dephospho-CoA kinase